MKYIEMSDIWAPPTSNIDSLKLCGNRVVDLFSRYIRLRGKVSVQFLGELMSLSRETLRESIRGATGKLPLAWRDELIMEDAKWLLIYTQNDVKDIAKVLNFKELREFNRFFKKYTGMLAPAYRKGHQKVVTHYEFTKV